MSKAKMASSSSTSFFQPRQPLINANTYAHPTSAFTFQGGRFLYDGIPVRGLTEQLKRVYYPTYNYYQAMQGMQREQKERKEEGEGEEEKKKAKTKNVSGKKKANKGTTGMKLGTLTGKRLALAVTLKKRYGIAAHVFERSKKHTQQQVDAEFSSRIQSVAHRKQIRVILNGRCRYFQYVWEQLNKRKLRPIHIELPVGVIVGGRQQILATGIDIVCFDEYNRFVIIELKTTSLTLAHLQQSTGANMNRPPFLNKTDCLLNQYFVQLAANFLFYRETFPSHSVVALLLIVTKQGDGHLFDLNTFLPLHEQDTALATLKKELCPPLPPSLPSFPPSLPFSSSTTLVPRPCQKREAGMVVGSTKPNHVGG